MRVVKLGGSLAGWADLPACLETLADLNCVVVPGGGPFADQVRQAQRTWHLDERTAHDMAVLAMAQFGRMLAGLEPRLATGCTPSVLATRVAEGRSAVWLPDPAEADLRALPPSWDITSDSLAAWLAGRMGATDLVLLKSAAIPDTDGDIAFLEASGLVDRALQSFTAGADYSVWICARERYETLRGTLDVSPQLQRVRQRCRN